MGEINNTVQVEKPQYYKMITFKAAPDLDQRLRESAKKQDISLSAVIRQSLVMTLSAEQVDKI